MLQTVSLASVVDHPLVMLVLPVLLLCVALACHLVVVEKALLLLLMWLPVLQA